MDARGLDRQGGAAHAGPGEACDYADAGEHLFAAKHRFAEVAFQILRRDLQHRLRVFQQLHHCLAHQLAQLLLQLTHTSFTGIAFDHRFHGAVADGEALLGHAGLVQQLGPQVTLGDGQLLLGDVAGQADHLHAVE